MCRQVQAGRPAGCVYFIKRWVSAHQLLQIGKRDLQTAAAYRPDLRNAETLLFSRRTCSFVFFLLSGTDTF